jgi:hypothetical protein
MWGSLSAQSDTYFVGAVGVCLGVFFCFLPACGAGLFFLPDCCAICPSSFQIQIPESLPIPGLERTG